jgi:uncharacterized protein
VELKREQASGGPLVTGFSGRGFKVGEARFPSGLLLTPEAAQAWDAPAIETLGAAALGELLDRDPRPEFLLLGTGASLVQPPRAFTRALEAKSIGVEVMDSRAAARAWGVLRIEGRDIVAALMPL